MVFVSIHSDDFVALGVGNVGYLLLNVVRDRALQKRFAIFRDEHDMYFETVLAPIMAMVAVFACFKCQIADGLACLCIDG